jgi:hypothetical protein
LIQDLEGKPMDEQIKKITLAGGLQVGIKNLRIILSEVAELKLTDNQDLKQQLLDRVKDNGNYVPPSAENEYTAALIRQYLQKYGETEEIRNKNRDIVEPHKHTKG